MPGATHNGSDWEALQAVRADLADIEAKLDQQLAGPSTIDRVAPNQAIVDQPCDLSLVFSQLAAGNV